MRSSESGAPSAGTGPVDVGTAPGAPAEEVPAYDPGHIDQGDPNPQADLPCGKFMDQMGKTGPAAEPMSKYLGKTARSSLIRFMVEEVATASDAKTLLKQTTAVLAAVGIIARFQRLVQLWLALEFTMEPSAQSIHKPLTGGGQKKYVTLFAKASIEEETWLSDQDDFFSHNRAYQILRDCLKSVGGIGFTDLWEIGEEMKKQHVTWDIPDSIATYVSIDPGMKFTEGTTMGVVMDSAHASHANLTFDVEPEAKHSTDSVPRVHPVTVTAALETWKPWNLDALVNQLTGHYIKSLEDQGDSTDKLDAEVRSFIASQIAALMERMTRKSVTTTFDVEYCGYRRRLMVDYVRRDVVVSDTHTVGIDASGETTKITRFSGLLEERDDGVFAGDIAVQMKMWDSADVAIVVVPPHDDSPGQGVNSDKNGTWDGVQIFLASATLVENLTIPDFPPTPSGESSPAPHSSGNVAMSINLHADAKRPAWLRKTPDTPGYEKIDGVPSLPGLNQPVTLSVRVALDDQKGSVSYSTTTGPTSVPIPFLSLKVTTIENVLSKWLPPQQADNHTPAP